LSIKINGGAKAGKMGRERSSVEEAIRDIHHKTRRQYSGEEKTRIVIEGLRGEQSAALLY
jgi:transposase